MPAKCSTEGLPQNVRRRLHSDLRKVYAIPCGLIHLLLLRLDMLEGTVTELKKDVEKCACWCIRSVCNLLICGLPKIVLRTLVRRFRKHSKEYFMGSQQMIHGAAEYIPIISAQVFTEIHDRLPKKSSDFRKYLLTMLQINTVTVIIHAYMYFVHSFYAYLIPASRL